MELRMCSQAPPPSDHRLTHATMEVVARLVLRGLCRSSALRLRSDAFFPFLDDTPLPTNQLGSSLLTLRQSVDNFSSLPAGTAAAVAPLFTDPHAPVTERGLLGVLLPSEAKNSSGDAVSALQVQSAGGVWQSISLKETEVAVLPGAMLEQLTAGLIPPATRRVVGEPFGLADDAVSRARREVHFELLPLPSAVLDCQALLAQAGHEVPARWVLLTHSLQLGSHQQESIAPTGETACLLLTSAQEDRQCPPGRPLPPLPG